MRLTAVASDFRATDFPRLAFDFLINFATFGLGAGRRFRETGFAAIFLLMGAADGFRAAVFLLGLAFFFDVGMRSSCPIHYPPPFAESWQMGEDNGWGTKNPLRQGRRGFAVPP
jgi:hypothetical protein